jgi:RNA polymerase sigma factor (sigma-70 family)
MRHTSVPDTMDDCVQQYSPFIRWAIRRVCRGRVRADDMPDYLQMVFLRLLEKSCLARAAELIRERGAGAFTTYLYLVVRSVMVNEIRRNAKDPLFLACRFESRERFEERRDPDTAYPDQAPEAMVRDTTFETRVHQRILLDRFAVTILRTQRGAQLARTLQLVYEGYTTAEIMEVADASESRVVESRRELRTRFRAYHQRRAG